MDIATEMGKQIDVFIKDNNMPISFRPCFLAAAWIGARVAVQDFANTLLKEQEKDNQILNEVFKNN